MEGGVPFSRPAPKCRPSRTKASTAPGERPNKLLKPPVARPGAPLPDRRGPLPADRTHQRPHAPRVRTAPAGHLPEPGQRGGRFMPATATAPRSGEPGPRSAFRPATYENSRQYQPSARTLCSRPGPIPATARLTRSSHRSAATPSRSVSRTPLRKSGPLSRVTRTCATVQLSPWTTGVAAVTPPVRSSTRPRSPAGSSSQGTRSVMPASRPGALGSSPQRPVRVQFCVAAHLGQRCLPLHGVQS